MLLLSTNNNNNAFVRLAFMPFKATTFLRKIHTTYRPIKAAQSLCIPPSTSNRNNQTSVTITQAVLSPNTLPELTDNPLFPQRQVFQPVWGKIGIFSAGIYQQFPPPSNSCSTHPTSSSHIPHPTPTSSPPACPFPFTPHFSHPSHPGNHVFHHRSLGLQAPSGLRDPSWLPPRCRRQSRCPSRCCREQHRRQEQLQFILS